MFILPEINDLYNKFSSKVYEGNILDKKIFLELNIILFFLTGVYTLKLLLNPIKK